MYARNGFCASSPSHLRAALQGKAYHAVSVPGFCLAEAGNHWHALERQRPPQQPAQRQQRRQQQQAGLLGGDSAASELHGSSGGLERWLGEWCSLKPRCPAAWLARMEPLWGFFHCLEDILGGGAAGTAHVDGPAAALARAVARVLQEQQG